MQLITPKQIRELLCMNKKQYQHYLNEGMPHLFVGKKIRFNKTEVVEWLQQYIMKQEHLEKAFVDKKGRSIDAYMTISVLKERLQLKKKQILRLCAKGMPHEVIGEKYFFCLEDVFSYFRPKEPITNEEPVVIIVDGSYYHKTKEISTGMVIQQEGKVKGYSALHQTKRVQPVFSEYVAIREALLYVKEKRLSNVIIGTDQANFAVNWKNGEKKYYPWMKKAVCFDTIKEIYELIDELKGRIQFVYANVPTYATLYHNAHALSRNYEDVVVERLSVNEKLPVKKRIERPSSSDIVNVSNTKNHDDHTLHISFDCIEKNYVYFHVTTKGKTKRTKMHHSLVTRAAILLARSYIHNAKEKMTVYIDYIQTFEEDLNKMYKSYTMENTVKLIKELYEKTNFYPTNDFSRCLKEIEEIAISA